MDKEQIDKETEELKEMTEKLKDKIKKVKEAEKAEKDLSKKEKKSKEVKKVKVTVGEDEYMIPSEAIVNYSKKDFKLKEDIKRISKGEVLILFLRESGVGEFKYVKPDNGMFIVDGRYYHVRGNCIFNVGKKRIPLAVIPEWSFIPLSRIEYETKLHASEQEAQLLIIKSLENAEVVKINQETEPAKKADSKLIIWIIIGAIVGLFFLNRFFGT